MATQGRFPARASSVVTPARPRASPASALVPAAVEWPDAPVVGSRAAAGFDLVAHRCPEDQSRADRPTGPRRGQVIAAKVHPGRAGEHRHVESIVDEDRHRQVVDQPARQRQQPAIGQGLGAELHRGDAACHRLPTTRQRIPAGEQAIVGDQEEAEGRG